MGDGTVTTEKKRNPKFQIAAISPNYLKYINDKFERFSGTVSLKNTSSEQAEKSRISGFSEDALEENYNDVYQLQIMRHPDLSEFRDWYETGEKVWPSDIILTPTTLKHWYCGDGHYNNSGTANHIEISMSNEVDNTGKVNNLFNQSGIPSPSNYKVYERDDGYVNCAAEFTVKQSNILWDYMGNPPPDFQYKWPTEYR